MNVSHNHSHSQHLTATRKVYAAPKLQRFGGIGTLTAGGSGKIQENKSKNGKGCGSAKKKHC